MPVLKRIQAKIADVKKDVKRVDRKVDSVIAEMKGRSERMDAFEDYFTYTMGVTERNKVDIKRIGAKVKELASKPDGKGKSS